MRCGCPIRTRRHGGFILVTVLFVSLLLLSTAVSYAFFARQQMKRVQSEEFAMLSRQLASIACDTVGRWIAIDSNGYDSFLEPLYLPGVPIILNYGEWDVTIHITPMDALFPINGLFLPDGTTLRTEFERAWEIFWNSAPDPTLSQTVLDFLDTDSDSRPGGVDNDQSINRKISSLSELIRVDGISEDMIYSEKESDKKTFDKFFTIYGDKGININIAPKHVIIAMDRDLNDMIADAVIEARSKEPIASEKDLVKIPGFPMTAYARIKNILLYDSSHFLVEMNVSNGQSERNFVITLKRGTSDCSIVGWEE